MLLKDMFFHGYIYKDEKEIKSKNLRALVRKIKDYHVFLADNKDYHTKIYKVGDGIAVSEKK